MKKNATTFKNLKSKKVSIPDKAQVFCLGKGKLKSGKTIDKIAELSTDEHR